MTPAERVRVMVERYRAAVLRGVAPAVAVGESYTIWTTKRRKA